MQTDTALQQLADTRDAVVRAVDRLSEAQLTFTPSPHRWSIANVVEHLARVEDFFVQRIAGRATAIDASDAGGGGDQRGAEAGRHNDDRIVEWERDPAHTVVVPGRVSLGAAPPPIRPSGRPVGDSLARFLRGRQQSSAFLESTPAPRLRAFALEHPALGVLDAYQWALFIGAHTTRHLTQIAAIKADARFPCATCS